MEAKVESAPRLLKRSFEAGERLRADDLNRAIDAASRFAEEQALCWSPPGVITDWKDEAEEQGLVVSGITAHLGNGRIQELKLTLPKQEREWILKADGATLKLDAAPQENHEPLHKSIHVFVREPREGSFESYLTPITWNVGPWERVSERLARLLPDLPYPHPLFFHWGVAALARRNGSPLYLLREIVRSVLGYPEWLNPAQLEVPKVVSEVKNKGFLVRPESQTDTEGWNWGFITTADHVGAANLLCEGGQQTKCYRTQSPANGPKPKLDAAIETSIRGRWLQVKEMR